MLHHSTILRPFSWGFSWKPPYALYTHVDPFGAKFSTLPLWFAAENFFFSSLTRSVRPASSPHASMSFPIVLCSFTENACRNFSAGLSDCSQFFFLPLIQRGRQQISSSDTLKWKEYNLKYLNIRGILVECKDIWIMRMKPLQLHRYFTYCSRQL